MDWALSSAPTLEDASSNTRTASAQIADRSLRSVYTVKDSMARNMYSFMVFISSLWVPSCGALSLRPAMRSVIRSRSSMRMARSEMPARLCVAVSADDLTISSTQPSTILRYDSSDGWSPALTAALHLSTAPAKSPDAIFENPCSMALSGSTCSAAPCTGWTDGAVDAGVSKYSPHFMQKLESSGDA